RWLPGWLPAYPANPPYWKIPYILGKPLALFQLGKVPQFAQCHPPQLLDSLGPVQVPPGRLVEPARSRIAPKHPESGSALAPISQIVDGMTQQRAAHSHPRETFLQIDGVQFAGPRICGVVPARSRVGEANDLI